LNKLEDLLGELNESQKAAVSTDKKQCIVIAGPGSGKTSVVASRAIFLNKKKNVPCERILVMTFSKAAATEMGSRTVRLGGTDFNKVSFSTIHAFSYRLLMELSRDALLDEKQALELFTKSVNSVSKEISRDREAILHLYSEVGYLKNTFGKPENFNSEVLSKDKFTKIYFDYQERKIHDNKLDFDDLLIQSEIILRDRKLTKEIHSRFDAIIVDEFQDINPVQFSIIKSLSARKGLMVVGDEDQSIYGFRGAVPDIMIRFKDYFPDADSFMLEKNYRVPEPIMEKASLLIKNNEKRYEKTITAEKKEGAPPSIIQVKNQSEEALEVAKKINEFRNSGEELSDIAVLYRNNHQAALTAEKLADLNIPFQAPEGIYTVYDHWIWQDIYAYFKIAVGAGDGADLSRIINKPLRYISRAVVEGIIRRGDNFFESLFDTSGLNKSQEKNLLKLVADIEWMSANKNPSKMFEYIRTHIGYEKHIKDFTQEYGIAIEPLLEILEGISEAAAEYDDAVSFLKHAEEMKRKLNKKFVEGDKVSLMTMHKSKGLEFKKVFIIGAVEGLTPSLPKEKGREVSIAEERRLFYVAMTRSKEELFIYVPELRYAKKADPSRFITELFGENITKNSKFLDGLKVYHKIFGEGQIIDIIELDENKKVIKNKSIKVDFNGNVRTLDYNTCVKNGYLKIVN